ncbi:MAG: hypothetical protein Q4B09_04965 [Lachnospiraceae bacterium]|nr:hypothetical protein [Lachnospiraceae bacterium]
MNYLESFLFLYLVLGIIYRIYWDYTRVTLTRLRGKWQHSRHSHRILISMYLILLWPKELLKEL